MIGPMDNQIRNFSIIAHIDHGKSTLADRLLELTGTIEKRKMREQVLDSMDLERERGITIKMTPVTLTYRRSATTYNLNLIDTPGHIDFAYEVSRALKAVEGVVLLVDASQGVEAQTLSVLSMAQELGLVIIPVVNKIDLPAAQVAEVSHDLAALLGVAPAEVLAVSGKTGAGVPELLTAIVERIPPPDQPLAQVNGVRGLIFDFAYSTHQGLIVYTRVLEGSIKKGDLIRFVAAEENCVVQEVGLFQPQKVATSILLAGMIGYVVTGLKETGRAKVGDTLINPAVPKLPIPGYAEPKPVVWASVYPASQDDFPALKQALGRLQLSDASLSFEEESSGVLGRGFRCGFLGLLHLEIITERLRREFNLKLVIATPTIAYQIVDAVRGTKETITAPYLFPENLKDQQVLEPWVEATIIVPPTYLNGLMKLFHRHEVVLETTANFSHDRTALEVTLPLRELMRNFFDELKSLSSGFASLSYRLSDSKPAAVVRLDVLINDDLVPAFSRIVAASRVEEEAQAVAERLKELLPRQLIMVKIQARALGRILAARSISAMRKDVTNYLYGGDITRKMKLREKQKKGKKKMQARGRVDIPSEVFLKMVASEK